MCTERSTWGWGFLTLLSFVLALTGCRSSGGLSLSGGKYDYISPRMPEPGPVVVPTVTPTQKATPLPLPTPEAVTAVEEAPVVSDELDSREEAGEGSSDEDSGTSEASKGLFSGWFSRSKPKDVERVGDSVPASVDEDAEQASGTLPDRVYRIKTGDVVVVTLTGSGGLSEQVETVIDSEGDLKLRYIGAVHAAGLSTTQLEREIELEYTDRQKIYRNVTARVVVPNKFYFIGGEVRQPGKFPIAGRVTLSQAVVAAGNFTEWANEKKIVLVRNNQRVVLDFRDIERNPLLDVEILPGDVLTVSRSVL